MNPFSELLGIVLDQLAEMQTSGLLPGELDFARVQVEPPRDASHGDAATNAAMVLAKPARMRPHDIAGQLAERLMSHPQVVSAEAVGPGFVNLRLDDGFWQDQIGAVLAAADNYGRCDIGAGRAVNVEFCSANPTGPLHVGHARGTIVGDALASLLEHGGYQVTREYYVNDGGAQIETLGRSVHHRYREALGDDVGDMPDGYYPLAELIPVAQALVETHGDRFREAPEAEWLDLFGRAAVEAMLTRIREDVAAAGVVFDLFSSERALIEGGKVDAALARLDELGLLYTGTLPPPKGKPVDDWEPVPQLLFKATDYGDDIDRPLKRSTGAWTYFAADLAYHHDKYVRGFATQIDVWGADHGGYVKRMQAAVRALSQDEAALKVMLCRLVNLFDGGVPLKMSKRAGRIVWMRDVIDEVGRDAFRFMMLTRKNDAPLDFDLQKVLEQSKENPVFYVQYAHARICSVFRNAAELGIRPDGDALKAAARARISDPAELTVVRRMATFPRMIEGAVEQFEPHRIAFYLNDLASDFHVLWSRGRDDSSLRFLIEGDRELTLARLAMLAAVRQVLALGMRIIGVRPVEEMS